MANRPVSSDCVRRTLVRPRRPGKSQRRAACLLLSAAALFGSGGCPIDADAVVTATIDGALTAAVDSFIETLAQYLAGN